MRKAHVVHASSAGTAVVEIKVGKEYSNRHGKEQELLGF